jgi:[NiFe] hydrogenase diaphorase moiety large subunit
MDSNPNHLLVQEITRKLDIYGCVRSALPFILPLLQSANAQDLKPAIQFLSEQLDIPPVEIFSLLSFYQTGPYLRGSQIDIQLCHAYWFEKSKVKELAQALQHKFQIAFGSVTENGEISLNWSSCPGYPNQAPVLLVNDVIYTHVKPQDLDEIVASCGNQIYFPNFALPFTWIEPMPFSSLKQGKAINSVMRNTPRPTRKSAQRMIVCNVDEGEPLAFKSRALLSEYIELTLEGMLITAYLTRIPKGLIYLPKRYGFMQSLLNQHLEQFRSRKVLGANVLGLEDFNFDIEVLIGMGDYVGRESSALTAMLNGSRPEYEAALPPTALSYLILPVDYFLKAAAVVADAFLPIEDLDGQISQTPAIISVSGDCTQPGIYEIKEGTTIADLLKHIGGEDAFGVQVGGMSAGLTLAEDFNRPIMKDEFAKTASVIVFGPETNLPEAARDILRYFHDASCGQCTPCRNGIPVLLKSLQPTPTNKKKQTSLSELRSLAETIQLTSKCSLGQNAPNAYLSILDIMEQKQRS